MLSLLDGREAPLICFQILAKNLISTHFFFVSSFSLVHHFFSFSPASFIKPSHKSCKVRLFSGYIHSSQMIDQRGLQYKPTWVMAFLLFSLHSLLSFYAVILFSQNHNQAGCRSQVPDLFTNTPDQPPLPSPVICFMLLWILPPGVWGGLAQDRN